MVAQVRVVTVETHASFLHSFIHVLSAYYVQVVFWALREKQIKMPVLVRI